LNILPSSIARRLKVEPSIIADGYADSTILFGSLTFPVKLCMPEFTRYTANFRNIQKLSSLKRER